MVKASFLMLEQAASTEMVTKTQTGVKLVARVPLLTFKCKFEILVLKDLPFKDFVQQTCTLKSENNPTRV